MYSSKTIKERWGITLKSKESRRITLSNTKGTIKCNRYDYITILEFLKKYRTLDEKIKCSEELREDLYYYRDRVRRLGAIKYLPAKFLANMLDLDLYVFEEIFRRSCVKPNVYDYMKILDTIANSRKKTINSSNIKILENILSRLAKSAKDDTQRVRIGSAIIRMVEKTFKVKHKKTAYETIGDNLMTFEINKDNDTSESSAVPIIKQNTVQKWYQKFI